MANNKLTNERMDDETLHELIESRRVLVNHHTEEGNKHQVTLHTLVLNALIELQEYRKAAEHPAPQPPLITDSVITDSGDDREMLKRLAVILSGSDAPGEIRSLTVTAQSFVDRCKTLANELEYRSSTPGLMPGAVLFISAQSQALSDVAAERQRQITEEGWTPEGDDDHFEGQMADAAACYALFATEQGFSTPAHWPWSPDWWKQSGQRRDLVKAGALILAEIERLDRAEAAKNGR